MPHGWHPKTDWRLRMPDSQLRTAPPPAETALVVSLGKSHGTSMVAAGLSLVSAAEHGSEVLLAELDPGGGELLEKLFFRGRPTTASERSVPAGARELADRLSGLELDFDPESEVATFEEIDLRGDFTVKLHGLDGLSVILGDALVGVAGQASRVITPSLKRMASHAGFDVVVVDGGRWNSGQAGRLAGVDVVYAVVEANSTSQLHRCVAEMQALWHQLHRASSVSRMVVVLINLAWDTLDVVDLFLAPPGIPERQTVPYRVVPLEFSRRGGRAVALIRDGKWKAAADLKGGLTAFRAIASVVGERSTSEPPESGSDEWADGGDEVLPIEEFPYLSEVISEGYTGGLDVADDAMPIATAGAAAPDDALVVDELSAGDGWPFTDFGSVAAPGRPVDASSEKPASETLAGEGSDGQTRPQPPALPLSATRSVEQPMGEREAAGSSDWPPPPSFRSEQSERAQPMSAQFGDPENRGDEPDPEPSPAIRAALAAQSSPLPRRFRRESTE